ncbi:MAG: T9SS type A sorting domain-containing protein [Bacteroidia bacterium]|nr:T9SS type A sorting domain-containing protein [Bacteroidia bacterium]
MKYISFVMIMLSLSFCGYSQFTIPLPVVYTPDHTIYLSPTGNDSNSGTMNSPKKTFMSAVNTFDFGVNNISNSESYNEIVFLPGDYYPALTLSQTASQYIKTTPGGDKLYKNISLRGIGNVVIHGDSAQNAGYSTLVSLMGSHIYVRNITLKNSKYAGIKFIGGNRHCTNIEVDSLTVDSAPSHGCLFTLADTILVKNSIITNTCNENSDETASNCQWGSALKTEFCKAITFQKNKVFRNWGEGINTSLSEGIYCFKNEAYDNYSTNIYLHSAAKGIWDSNLVYNTDSLFWRACYNPNGIRKPPSGISIANELTCTDICLSGGNNNACGGKYHCCAYYPHDAVFLNIYPYRQTDSIFVYNNVLLQTDISLWDAFSGFLNYAFMKDVFIENNTVIGVFGRTTLKKSPINVTLGTSFIHAQNLRIKNNIFTQDTSLSAYKAGISVYIPSGVCNGLSDGNIVTLNNNRWNTAKITTNNAIGTATEQILASLPTAIAPAQLSALIPNNQQPYWIQTATPSSYITKDFLGNPRQGITNVGALEKDVTIPIDTETENALFEAFPNPATETLLLRTQSQSIFRFTIYDPKGCIQQKSEWIQGEKEISVSGLSSGVYYLRIETDNQSEFYKKIAVIHP